MLDPEKFRRELKLKGMSLKLLHERSGMNYAHLSNLGSGKVKDVKFATIQAIATFMGIHPHRLMQDAVLDDLFKRKLEEDISTLDRSEWVHYLDRMLDLGAVSPGDSSQLLRRIPILGVVHSHGRHTLPEGVGTVPPMSIVSQGRSIIFPDVDDELAYAVTVDDPDVKDEFRPGTILLMSPKIERELPSLCLVRDKSGKCWVRHVYRPEDKYILVARDPGVAPIVVNRDAVEYAHPVVGQQSLMI